MVEHGPHVLDHLRDVAAGTPGRRAIAGTEEGDQAQAVRVRGVLDSAERAGRAGSAVVKQQRWAIGRPADLDRSRRPSGTSMSITSSYGERAGGTRSFSGSRSARYLGRRRHLCWAPAPTMRSVDDESAGRGVGRQRDRRRRRSRSGCRRAPRSCSARARCRRSLPASGRRGTGGRRWRRCRRGTGCCRAAPASRRVDAEAGDGRRGGVHREQVAAVVRDLHPARRGLLVRVRAGADRGEHAVGAVVERGNRAGAGAGVRVGDEQLRGLVGRNSEPNGPMRLWRERRTGAAVSRPNGETVKLSMSWVLTRVATSRSPVALNRMSPTPEPSGTARPRRGSGSAWPNGDSQKPR